MPLDFDRGALLNAMEVTRQAHKMSPKLFNYLYRINPDRFGFYPMEFRENDHLIGFAIQEHMLLRQRVNALEERHRYTTRMLAQMDRLTYEHEKAQEEADEAQRERERAEAKKPTFGDVDSTT